MKLSDLFKPKKKIYCKDCVWWNVSKCDYQCVGTKIDKITGLEIKERYTAEYIAFLGKGLDWKHDHRKNHEVMNEKNKCEWFADKTKTTIKFKGQE